MAQRERERQRDRDRDTHTHTHIHMYNNSHNSLTIVSLCLSLAYNSLSGTLNILSQIQLSHQHINTFFSLSLSIPSLLKTQASKDGSIWLWVSLWWDFTDNSQLDECWWLVSQSQEDSNYKGATPPVQCNNTHQLRKRLNRCYQFNATVLVLFLFWWKKISMEPCFLPPSPSGSFYPSGRCRQNGYHKQQDLAKFISY
jgi:hypothetical protein